MLFCLLIVFDIGGNGLLEAYRIFILGMSTGRDPRNFPPLGVETKLSVWRILN